MCGNLNLALRQMLQDTEANAESTRLDLATQLADSKRQHQEMLTNFRDQLIEKSKQAQSIVLPTPQSLPQPAIPIAATKAIDSPAQAEVIMDTPAPTIPSTLKSSLKSNSSSSQVRSTSCPQIESQVGCCS